MEKPDKQSSLKAKCNCQVGFCIFVLIILLAGVVLQSMAVSAETKWDTFDTVILAKRFLHHDLEISAYQTLYDVVVSKDVPMKDSSLVPTAYPIKKEEFNVGWKEHIRKYETASQGLGIGALVLLENALLIQCLNPDGRWSRIFQPINMMTSTLLSVIAGGLSIYGAFDYADKYQTVYYVVSGPQRIKMKYQQLTKYGLSYHFEDNVLSTGYLLSLIAGVSFCLTGVLSSVNFILYIKRRHKNSKMTKVENIEEN